MFAIQANQLIREYAPGRGACGVTLAVDSGESFVLLGRNGSGKSTLTNLLIGVEKPTSGSLQVLGCEVSNGSRKHLNNLGIALDTSIHWEQLSGWDNAYFVARSYGLAHKEIESGLEKLFDLSGLYGQAHDPVRTYSFGMRRKLSVIQALCHDPELLILDEPTSGLDAHFLLNLTELMRSRSRSGKTTWIAGNDPDWISGVATRVAFIEAGRICAEGTVEALVNEVSTYQELGVKLFQSSLIKPPGIPGVQSFEQSGETILAILDRDAALVPQVMEWIVSQGGTIRNVEVKQTSLRDAFLLKTGRTLEQ